MKTLNRDTSEIRVGVWPGVRTWIALALIGVILGVLLGLAQLPREQERFGGKVMQPVATATGRP